jgi:glycosyltransferase involved in cell wall biosynthesis
MTRRADAPTRTVTLVLILRNEEAGVRALLPNTPIDLFDDCFAVDGHSTDRTVEVLEGHGVRVYQQTEKGLGAAMLEARRRVRTDAFVYFHPDGNEDPADLQRLAGLLREGHEFVVASRMIAGARNEEDDRLFRWRKAANRGFALLANLFFAHGGNRTTDVTNGFRGVSCAAFDRMRLTAKDLTLDYQMVIRALKLGIPITEFPTREGARLSGATNFASLPTGVAELKLLGREILMGVRTVDGPRARAA